MGRTLLYNANIVNEGESFKGYILIDGEFISEVKPCADSVTDSDSPLAALAAGCDRAIDCGGRMVMPGVIDTHVHFRDPGMTEKGDIATESRAAIAGGVTSYIDMPNTRPATTSMSAVEAKLNRAAEVSSANYGFFIGATNDNIHELLEADYTRVAGVKLFMGSSTGNMLVDREGTLGEIFSRIPAVIAVHAEDEAIINAARERLTREYDGDIPVECHPDVRPREACVAATDHAIELAKRHGARLHVCHISTAEELQHIKAAKAAGVKVTAETCPQYLLFDRNDFLLSGARIKCNPAIKEASDRIALLRQLHHGVIDSIATDHAPHLPAQKEGNALTAASGMPMVQFSLPAVMDVMRHEPECEGMTPADVVELMCHAPARIFGIDRRGYLRPGYYADIVVLSGEESGNTAMHKITDGDVVSRCGWTPMAGRVLSDKVDMVILNGDVAYAEGEFRPAKVMPLRFNNPITADGPTESRP